MPHSQGKSSDSLKAVIGQFGDNATKHVKGEDQMPSST